MVRNLIVMAVRLVAAARSGRALAMAVAVLAGGAMPAAAALKLDVTGGTVQPLPKGARCGRNKRWSTP